jgi:hypothetical protein
MSYDEKTGQMDWKDELVWILISIISGLLLAFLFYYFQKFPNANNLLITLISCLSFYILSILLRVQNHRGILLTGKTSFNENMLKYIFPILGFVVGLALIFL